jgi:choline dehydrogenase-like flavoprotein
VGGAGFGKWWQERPLLPAGGVIRYVSVSMAETQPYDAVVVGSGFGGTMVAAELVAAGQRVLLLERGGWVERGPHNWNELDGFFQLTPGYTLETSYSVQQDGGTEEQGICACVGGPSVFYGGASFRFRERDFAPAPEIVGDTGAEWPFGYSELETHYARAEALLGVAGSAGEDPTEPPRSTGFAAPAAPLAPVARRIAGAAEALRLHPSRIPLAINYSATAGGVCSACTTCDGFACAVGAKRDLAHWMIPSLVQRGMELRTDAVVTRLEERGGRVAAVEGVDRVTGERFRACGARVILSAGALASPHLLLASGLERVNPSGHLVGRHLMRHCNAFVYGFFLPAPHTGRVHHKQIALFDYYFGDPDGGAPAGKLGSMQQVMAPPTGGPFHNITRMHRVVERAARLGEPSLRRMLGFLTGLLVIAEDQPRYGNRVELVSGEYDRFGLPRARVVHRYSRRDLQARAALARRAKAVLRQAGARFSVTKNVTTFSHAVGTVRMGSDPATSPLDEMCRYRGIENLYVVDGSFMPTSAGVNPSLTIAANALRVGHHLGKHGD